MTGMAKKTVRRIAVAATLAMAGTVTLSGIGAPAAHAANNPARGKIYATNGCNVLASVDLDASDAAILRGFRTAKVQFQRAGSFDSQYREMATAAANVEKSVTRRNQTLLESALEVLVVDCKFLGVDLAVAWGVASAPPPAPTTTVAATVPTPAVNRAPRADPRNTAFNNELPLQNDGVPFNFPIPSDFRPVTSSLPGKTYRSFFAETTGSQLAVFEQGCKDIGWPVIEKLDSRPYVLDGVSGTAAGIVCRSHDGGAAGQPAPWRLEILIIAQQGGSVFNVVLKRG